MPISNFPEPFCTSTWCNDTIVYVNVFLNQEQSHYHFFFNIETREITGLQKLKLECNDKNFPWKSFYNSDENEVYTFYR